MKVLLITAYFKEEKRAIQSSYNLAQGLARKGIQVIVVTSRFISKPKFEKHKNIKIYQTDDYFVKDPLNYSFMFNLRKDLKNIIDKEKPDISIVAKYIFYPVFMIPFLKKRMPVITFIDTYPGIIWFTRSTLINFLTKIYYHIIGRLYLKKSNHVVLMHEELIESTKRLGISKYSIIHNGITLNKLKANKPKDIKKKPGEIIITYVGRLEAVKGYDILIQAARQLLTKYDNIRFLFAGEVAGNKNIKDLPKHKKIEYLGYRTDIKDILLISDIFVMPSFSEGLPNGVMEAMAMKLPCIVTNVPGGMRILIRDGKEGLRFNKGNSSDLAIKIEKLIKNKELRLILGNNARKRIEQNFDFNESINDWIKLLQSEIKKYNKSQI